MDIPCEGGMLDGKTVKMEQPEGVIHQNGLTVLRVHRPYPVKKGMKTRDQLLSYTEDYKLTVTEAGPVYRCVAPFAGRIVVAGVMAAKMDDGGYEVWIDRENKASASPPAGE